MLSNYAKNNGIKTEWKCFQEKAIFKPISAILEICKRIEKLEEIENERNNR